MESIATHSIAQIVTSTSTSMNSFSVTMSRSTVECVLFLILLAHQQQLVIQRGSLMLCLNVCVHVRMNLHCGAFVCALDISTGAHLKVEKVLLLMPA